MTEPESGYVVWSNPDELAKALKSTAGNIDAYEGLQKSRAQVGRTFLNTDTNISVRSEYNRADYESYRGGETVPQTDEEIMRLAMIAYERVFIIRTTIDLMADFTVSGMRIVHPNSKINDFHERWWHTISGDMVSERIANMLYRVGNVPVKSAYGTINVATEQEWRKTYSEQPVKLEKTTVKA